MKNPIKSIKEKIHFKRELNTEIQLLAMRDTVRNCKIAMPFLILFELVMLVNWFLTFDHSFSMANYGYLFAYLAMIAVCTGVLISINAAGKDIEKNYRLIRIEQDVLCVFLVLWAVWITFVGAVFRSNFQLVLYFTIMTLIPIFCYLDPLMTIVVQALPAVVIIELASRYEQHFASFVTNYAVYLIISIVAGFSLYFMRRINYIRRIELKRLHEQSETLAYTDSLTGLRNHRAYMEESIRLEQEGIPAKLVLASFDVNGLKTANDTMGHEAGDELICCAANALKAVFSGFGEVFRAGGDEFYGILYMTDEELEKARLDLKASIKKQKGKYISEVSMAAGFAQASLAEGKDMNSLFRLADEAMYKEKSEYYENGKHKRRE